MFQFSGYSNEAKSRFKRTDVNGRRTEVRQTKSSEYNTQNFLRIFTTYRILSGSSIFVFFFVWAWTGEMLGSLPEAGGEEERLLEDKLPALPRLSIAVVRLWFVLTVKTGLELRLRFFFFLLVSISSILPKILLVGGGGIQSKSFLRCPLPHLQAQAL